ncbi:transcription factor bHLH162-like [Momordica charantia]|uniref:Transcription factor bHLH162-like n=1 Tax=Momordica charantia TaxID=3673 RepID=A0A6J1C669_MOMCH|nr:transcription factor bHLH162-like [Momordica charantia]
MAKRGGAETSLKLDRKTIEKNRRVHMKSLCSKLVSLIPPSHFKISKDLLSQQNQISYVIAYINELKERVEKLEKKKRALEFTHHHHHHQASRSPGGGGSTLPVVELRDLGSVIEVMLISDLNRNFLLCQVIAIVEEEGGQVVNASFSTLGGKILPLSPYPGENFSSGSRDFESREKTAGTGEPKLIGFWEDQSANELLAKRKKEKRNSKN